MVIRCARWARRSSAAVAKSGLSTNASGHSPRSRLLGKRAVERLARGQLDREPALTLGPPAVSLRRLARQAEIPRHRAVALARAQPQDQLANIQRHQSPPCHLNPPWFVVESRKGTPGVGRNCLGSVVDRSRPRFAAPGSEGIGVASLTGSLAAKTAGSPCAKSVATLRARTDSHRFSRRTRRVLVRRFPYSLLYRVDPDVIFVVAVAHVRRRPGYWRSDRSAQPSHAADGAARRR